ncbi:hypothetical protein [Nostoc sp.]|uniref:hypothetical protein n=1 Tax=Nostoc sp. TaxID=1180 RepID=UPI002FFCEB35
MTVARIICLGFLAVIAVNTILLMMAFSTSNGSYWLQQRYQSFADLKKLGVWRRDESRLYKSLE